LKIVIADKNMGYYYWDIIRWLLVVYVVVSTVIAVVLGFIAKQSMKKK